MASKVPKHECKWYPLSHKSGPDNRAYEFGKGHPKPRGFTPPELGDPILWACSFRYSAKEQYHGQDVWRGHSCIKTLAYPDYFRLQTKGTFLEGTGPTY